MKVATFDAKTRNPLHKDDHEKELAILLFCPKRFHFPGAYQPKSFIRQNHDPAKDPLKTAQNQLKETQNVPTDSDVPSLTAVCLKPGMSLFDCTPYCIKYRCYTRKNIVVST